MARLQDIQYRTLRELIGTRILSRSLVNLQNSTATFDSVTEPDAIIVGLAGGGAFTTADVTNKVLATLPALQNPVTGSDVYYDQPKSTTVYYLWVVNAAGTSYVIQGTYANQVLGYGFPRGPKGDGSIPDIAVPDTYAPVAVFKVVNGTNAVWVPGTTNWDAVGVVSSAAPVGILTADVTKYTFVAGGA
jgi:hypothetical protein